MKSTILIVEDQPQNIEVLVQVLDELYELSVALDLQPGQSNK